MTAIAHLAPPICKATRSEAGPPRYADLFKRPYLEVSNGRPAFAFFNPVFRIVALDGDEAHLARLAAALRSQYPGLSVAPVNAKAELP